MEERPNSFNFVLNLKPYNQHRNRRIFRPVIVLGDNYKKLPWIKPFQIFKYRIPLLKATVSTAINANSHQSAWLQEGKSLPNPDQGRGGLGSKGVITSRQITPARARDAPTIFKTNRHVDFMVENLPYLYCLLIIHQFRQKYNAFLSQAQKSVI